MSHSVGILAIFFAGPFALEIKHVRVEAHGALEITRFDDWNNLHGVLSGRFTFAGTFHIVMQGETLVKLRGLQGEHLGGFWVGQGLKPSQFFGQLCGMAKAKPWYKALKGEVRATPPQRS